MRSIALWILLAFSMSGCFAQKNAPSLHLKAYQRSYISGVAPTATVELGGKQTEAASTAHEPEYFIYLIAHKVPVGKIESLWIKQQLYFGNIDLITEKTVVVKNGHKADTLVGYTDWAIYQIKITGKDNKGIKPKKAIAARVTANEMVLRLVDTTGKVFTRTASHIGVLEAERGQ